ncbi:ABC transporter permease subunit [Streptomyces boncukensis]|uniref:ABC transporter permease subunit n=1 Tax=Streptomyces boncukensis TaxID=2711219 RepID=A0A6G4WSD2_9ACTN|nr:ABC transporter permease subunit [Streptomyces boncukensis]NGO67537.1 ABC transporter permease subunit [Streptomyces boncukensis]
MSSEPTTTAPAPAQRGQDVIHNIGYRRYEGQRLGRSYARRSLFIQSLRGAFGLGRSAKSKVLPMILLAATSLPAAIVVAVSVATNADELPVGYPEYVLLLQPVIGIFLAAVAPQMVSLDLRFKTTPLYFSRPIERSDYVAAKYAALSAAVFVVIAAPVVIMYAGAMLAKLDFGDETKGFFQGLVFCVVFALLHAALAAYLAALTPRRGFGIAAVIVVLTVPYFLMSALQAIADEQDSLSAVGWLALGSPGTLMDGLQSKFLGGASGFPGGHGLSNAQGALSLLVIAALIAGSYALLSRRYRKAGL